MVDFAMDVHKSLYPDREVPNTLKDKRAEVVENFKQLLDFLMKGYNFKPEMIDVCYNFAKSSTSV